MVHIERKKYLDELISLRHNGMIKVVTGMRRCGKSYLLFEIFASWLEKNGIASDPTICVHTWKVALRMTPCIISCWTRCRCSVTLRMC